MALVDSIVRVLPVVAVVVDSVVFAESVVVDPGVPRETDVVNDVGERVGTGHDIVVHEHMLGTSEQF